MAQKLLEEKKYYEKLVSPVEHEMTAGMPPAVKAAFEKQHRIYNRLKEQNDFLVEQIGKTAETETEETSRTVTIKPTTKSKSKSQTHYSIRIPPLLKNITSQRSPTSSTTRKLKYDNVGILDPSQGLSSNRPSARKQPNSLNPLRTADREMSVSARSQKNQGNSAAVGTGSRPNSASRVNSPNRLGTPRFTSSQDKEREAPTASTPRSQSSQSPNTSPDTSESPPHPLGNDESQSTSGDSPKSNKELAGEESGEELKEEQGDRNEEPSTLQEQQQQQQQQQQPKQKEKKLLPSVAPPSIEGAGQMQSLLPLEMFDEDEDRDEFLQRQLAIQKQFPYKATVSNSGMPDNLLPDHPSIQRLRAYSRHFSFANDYEWKPCIVLEYNDTERAYLIQWDIPNTNTNTNNNNNSNTGTSTPTGPSTDTNTTNSTKYVRRLNLFFEGEDPELFDERIERARRLRQQMEASMRLHTYIDSRPSKDIPTMPADVAEKIMMLTAYAIPGKFVPSVKSALEDARKDYVYANKKAIVMEMLRHEKTRKRLEPLHLPLPPPPPPTPESGVLPHEPYDYNTVRKHVIKHALSAKSTYLKATQQLRSIWVKFNAPIFFAGEKELAEMGLKRPYEAKDYLQKQQETIAKHRDVLLYQWMPSLVKAFRDIFPNPEMMTGIEGLHTERAKLNKYLQPSGISGAAGHSSSSSMLYPDDDFDRKMPPLPRMPGDAPFGEGEPGSIPSGNFPLLYFNKSDEIPKDWNQMQLAQMNSVERIDYLYNYEDMENNLSEMTNSEQLNRLYRFRADDLGRLSHLVDMVTREQLHMLIKETVKEFKRVIVDGYREYVMQNLCHLEEVRNRFAFFLMQHRTKFIEEPPKTKREKKEKEEPQEDDDTSSVHSKKKGGKESGKTSASHSRTNSIVNKHHDHSDSKDHNQSDNNSEVHTQDGTQGEGEEGKRNKEGASADDAAPKLTPISSPSFTCTPADFPTLGSMLYRTNEIIELSRRQIDDKLEQDIAEKGRLEKMGIVQYSQNAQRAASAGRHSASRRSSTVTRPGSHISTSSASSGTISPSHGLSMAPGSASSIKRGGTVGEIPNAETRTDANGRLAVIPAVSLGIGEINGTQPFPPPPSIPPEPKLDSNEKDNCVEIASKQTRYALQKAVFQDDILKEADPYYWDDRCFIAFPSATPALFTLALHLVEDTAFTEPKPDVLFLSTISAPSPKAEETGGLGHHIAIFPTVESIYVMVTQSIFTMQVNAGRNFPKFESFFVPGLSLPALPYQTIAEHDPEISQMRDAIIETIRLSMEPPLQLKSMYDAILVEVKDQANHRSIKLKPHYMIIQADKEKKRKAKEEKERKRREQLEREGIMLDEEEEEEKKKKAKNDKPRYRIEGRNKIRGRQRKMKKITQKPTATTSSAQMPQLDLQGKKGGRLATRPGAHGAAAKKAAAAAAKKAAQNAKKDEGEEGKEDEEDEDDYEYEDENGLFNGESQQDGLQRHLLEEMKDLETEISRLENLKLRISNLTQDVVPCGIMDVNTKPLKDKLLKVVDKMLKDVLDGIEAQINKNNETTLKRFQTLTDMAGKKPSNVEDLFQLLGEKDNSDAEIPILEHEINRSFMALELISKRMTPQKQTWQLLVQTQQAPAKMESVRDEQGTRLLNIRKELEDKHRQEMGAFTESMDALSSDVDGLAKYSRLSDVEEAASKVQGIKQKLDRFQAQVVIFNRHEKLFGWGETNFPHLAAVQRSFEPHYQLWSIAQQMTVSYEEWTEGPFLKLIPGDIDDKITTWMNAMYRLAQKPFKDMSGPRSIANAVREKLDAFKPNLELITALRREGMKEKHYDEISQKTGLPLKQSQELTLNYLLELGLLNHMAIIEAVSANAAAEYKLERELLDMMDAWKTLEFQTMPYKETGTFVLHQVDDIIQLMDDQLVSVQNMAGNSHVSNIESKRRKWEDTLLLLRSCIDEWLHCQVQWMYLEPIFSSDDIKKQLPGESSKFQEVDSMWKQQMALVNKSPRIIPLIDRDGLTMQNKFKKANEKLEDIQKHLDAYLEKKRQAFPRFYFLSDEDLLQILAKTKEPTAVQPHLRKCFEGIAKLTFVGEGEKCTVLAMTSAEGETVQFDKPVLAQGAVEGWLLQVEAMMRSSIRKLVQESLTAYNQYPREEWVLRWPAQVVIAVNGIMWTRQVADALKRGLNSVQQLEHKLSQQIENIVKMVGQAGRKKKKKPAKKPKKVEEPGSPKEGEEGEDGQSEDHQKEEGEGGEGEEAEEPEQEQEEQEEPQTGVQLSDNDRILLAAMLTIDVHSRDSVTHLLEARADSDSFEWASLLRYYWIDGNVRVMQNSANLPYGYEYLGNSSRLVITPLTDRCYMTLTGALHMNLGGAPAGPAGTGKTETVKDLAKAIAKQCVVFNCQEGLNIDAMSNFFKGLAMNGAWSCFDEFNRIDIEVLSVVAQQISCIQEAVRAHEAHFNFHGSEISLDPTYAVFITMNPGYAGRTELPDNLKALFRPMSMMIPDYALIAEISLFSCGFTKGRALAQKLVATFQLCSEQLSSQDHYDFGMRAVKTVLNAAAALKRDAEPDASEDELVLRALKDSNVPKFLNEDLPLFDGIIGDLFPGVNTPIPDYRDLTQALVDAAHDQDLQPVNALLFKCIQMYETTLVRHGMMLVGLPWSGKSSVSKVLRQALTLLHEREIPGFQPVHMHVLNPKSITLGQLYGTFDERSHEWSNGVLARVVRDCAMDTTEDQHWIVCDGPVDALWIENMNTVLDDNKKLCLPNREVIIFTQYMRMVFEVADLSQASPATVSRSGMVYMQPDTLGWRPMIVSWLMNLHKRLNPPIFGEKPGEYKKRLDASWQLLTCSGEQQETSRSGRDLGASLSETQREGKEQQKVSKIPSMAQLRPQSGYDTQSAVVPDLPGVPKTGETAALLLTYFFQTKLMRLVEWIIPPLLKFVKEHCTETMPHEEFGKINDVLRIFESILVEFVKDEAPEAMTQTSLNGWLESIFLFSAIWGIGGCIQGSDREAYSEEVRRIVAPVTDEKTADPHYVKLAKPLPEGGNVFDYCFDKKNNTWVTWNVIAPPFSISDEAQFHEVIVPTTDSIRATYLLTMLLNHQIPTLFGGSTGTGKTATVQAYLMGLDPKVWEPLVINFSAQTSANQTQDQIDAKLYQRRTNLFGPPGGKHLATFIDDLNMPQPERYLAQPPLELLRQLLDQGGWYNRKELVFRTIIGVYPVAAMAPPGGGRTAVTPRLARHFTRFVMPDMDHSTLTQIFNTLCNWILSKFPVSIKRLSESIVEAVTSVYFTISSELRPTPAKSHYTFNLRDVSKVFQGIASVGLAALGDDQLILTDADQLIRLVMHECERVFGDRLMGDKDKNWFKGMIQNVCMQTFHKDYNQMLVQKEEAGGGSSTIFGDFDNSGAYKEVTSISELQQQLMQSLEDYNSVYHSQPMNLVLFNQAIQHVARILRVVRTPKGHCLLIGVGGSGRKSLARLATFIADYELHSITPTKKYGRDEWHKDLQALLQRTGVDKKYCVFLISDDQLKEENWLEDISGILNTGVVPNLFEKEDLDKIIQAVQPDAQAAGKATSPAAVYNFFAERCQAHVRVVLCMSPLGDSFRNRLRMFPSLINCTTVDVFEEWTRDALLSVSEQYFDSGEGVGAIDIEMMKNISKLMEKNNSSSSGVLSNEIEPVKDISQLLVKIHLHVQEKSKQFMQEERRVYHITPTSFLNFLHAFAKIVKKKRQEILATKRRYVGGLDVLRKTEEDVTGMQKELMDMIPVQQQLHRETMDLMKTIEKDQKTASENKKVVEEEEKVVVVQESEAKELSDDCEAQLNAALPALMRAQEMIRKLEKKMLDEMKQMKHPPSGVKLVMEAICVMKGVKPTVIRTGTGKSEHDYWESSKKVLADPKFVNWIYTFNPEAELNDQTVANLQPYLKNADFVPEVVKNHSAAAANICGWIHAIVDYYEKTKIVRPKKKALEEARAKLEQIKQRLQEKRDSLAQIEAGLKELMDKYSEAVEKRDKLAEQVSTCEKKLKLAQNIIKGLSGEKTRWSQTATQQDENLRTLTGDIIISSAAIAYYGAFTMSYRAEITEYIKDQLKEISYLPISENASLIETLGVPLTIRQWQIAALPTDTYSTENAIIGTQGNSWPLFIDPQGQANRWIKNLEGKNLRIFRPDDKLMRNIESAVRLGWTVLIEGVTESIDTALYPLLAKAIFKQQGQLMIHLGDSDVEYDNNFKLYLTTKHPNPSYPPEISTKVCLVNFTLTPAGLEDQLLGMVIQSEMPAMEEQRNKLIVENAEVASQKKAAEDGILSMLTDDKQTDLLSDSTLADKLNKSKETAADAEAKMAENAKMTAKITESRKVYTAIAARGSALFFCIASLFNIDPMYQYSLNWFVNLFTSTLANEPENPNQNAKIQSIMTHLTEVIYDNVCRSLFQEHKLFFGFLLAMTVENLYGRVDKAERDFLADGASALSTRYNNPDPSWISERMWRDIAGICELKTFEDLDANFVKRQNVWKKWVQTSMDAPSEEAQAAAQAAAAAAQAANAGGGATGTVVNSGAATPGNTGAAGQVGGDTAGVGTTSSATAAAAAAAAAAANAASQQSSASFRIPPLPKPYLERASPLARLCLLRVLRPDWLPYGITDYIVSTIGEKFVTPPPFDLKSAFNDSNNLTPLVFVLSPGADPFQLLRDFADQMKKKDKLRTLSLGQKQDKPATDLINQGKERGLWVFLQNCHLYPSWMPAMEELLDSTDPATTHPDFRIWLTSMPTPTFPVTVLQNAVKMTNEPPIGVRANVQRAFLRYTDSFITESGAPVHWQRLLYNLAYFHAIILERRQFGPLGFNIPYEFNESDLLICESQLQMFIEQAVSKYQESVAATQAATNPEEAVIEAQTAAAEKKGKGRLRPGSSNLGTGGHSKSGAKGAGKKGGHKGAGAHAADAEETTTEIVFQPVATEIIQQINSFIPWKALRYITGQVNYGGRVTDDWDRRTLLSLLDQMYSPEALEDPEYRLNGKYPPPLSNTPFTKEQFLEYIDENLDTRDPPELFGLHRNAGLTLLRRQAGNIFTWLVELQPGIAAGNEEGQSKIINLAQDILKQIPEQNFDIPAIRKKYPTLHDECMNTVLVQDLVRYNKLLTTIRSTLNETVNALNGLVVLSAQCERITMNLTAGLVPEAWGPVSYPSLKPIGSWVSDLCSRLEFMQKWVDNGPPPVFPLPYFFFPQAFLTGTLQNYARSRHIPIDLIQFTHLIVEDPAESISAPPPNGEGCFVSGLFMDGARWDSVTHTIGESLSGELVVSVPVMWLRPAEKKKAASNENSEESNAPKGAAAEIDPITDEHKAKLPPGVVISDAPYAYSCPVYKISTRAGVLSTTGHSTNYVLTIKLPSLLPESHWVRRGVALLCQSD